VGFNITDQLLIRYFDLSDTAENIGAQWDNTSAIQRFQ
jgi:hypothetical protein